MEAAAQKGNQTPKNSDFLVFVNAKRSKNAILFSSVPQLNRLPQSIPAR